MPKLAKYPLLLLAVAFTTASTPSLPHVQPVTTLLPVGIIDGGTVSTVPKGTRRSGIVVIVRGRGDRSSGAAAAQRKSAVPRATRGREGQVVREPDVASGGGSAADVVEMRNTETGLRVLILGPDGLTRTRYVPSAHGATARHNQDE